MRVPKFEQIYLTTSWRNSVDQDQMSQNMASDQDDQFAIHPAYSRTSLSRTRLFRITAYLEVEIWSLF